MNSPNPLVAHFFKAKYCRLSCKARRKTMYQLSMTMWLRTRPINDLYQGWFAMGCLTNVSIITTFCHTKAFLVCVHLYTLAR
ncbi:hypothetical protein ES332_D07G274300v1 [Gossypium tomentosum]|uniref:Uncharacterized protein n=1 Tax=Gossypium tomentosum TaxID=34277 RepID=A0A5D2KBV6_GOSTO|nr:hypothetical protein ES332_D07G274300v1 [Gossypium tomentosum]